MKKIRIKKLYIGYLLLLALMISNFGVSFAYWADSVSGSETTSQASTTIGVWDFQEELLYGATIWDPTPTPPYIQGDIVYYNNVYYEKVKNGPTTKPPTEHNSWVIYLP